MTKAEISPDRFARLMELVGRCILRYQRIENTLKLMLPHLAKPGMDLETHTPNWREFLDSKHTLGPLMERFKDGLSSDQPDAAHAYLERVVSERNDLIHHFLVSSGALSGTSEALERGISELERRLESALPIERGLTEAAGKFVRELERSIDADERQGHRTL